LAFHLLERFGPRVVEQAEPGPFHEGWPADLTAAVVHGPVLSGLLEVLAAALVLRVPALAGPGVSRWPAWAQFALFFLGLDFLRYWLHRAHHASALLWRLHRVHHSAFRMCFFTSFRFHLGEALLVYVAIPLPFKVLGVSPGVILVYTALDLVKGFWQHANLRTYVGWGNLVLSSAEQHWWHHAAEGRGMHSNFGSFLCVWDRLFGTFYWPRGVWPERIGVDGIERFPRGYLGRFASMLRPDDAFGAKRSDQGPAGVSRSAARNPGSDAPSGEACPLGVGVPA
jgi:sterol desaturase/sphingolipid hydroxylase (fatty acid hydroxylase superfamily)